MLIIKRHMGDAIRIGEETVVTVLSADDDEVRIGIQAPRDLRVLREEIATHEQRKGRAPNLAPGTRRGHTGLYRRGRIQRNP